MVEATARQLARPTRLRRTRALLVAPLALTVLACFGPSNTIAEGYEGAPGVETFLLCAPNTVVGLAAELQHGSKRVGAIIGDYLESHGREVERLGLYECSTSWRLAVSQAKQESEIEDAPRYFAAALAQEHDFDAIVMPSILLRTVDAYMGEARWDGVRRTMPITNLPRLEGGFNQDYSRRGAQMGGVSGQVMVTSLHFLVFSNEGEKVFEGRGGLEFVHEADMRAAETVLRDDLFRNRDVLDKGIEIGLRPYLPPL